MWQILLFLDVNVIICFAPHAVYKQENKNRHKWRLEEDAGCGDDKVRQHL